jgi:hypothetical protein
VTNSLVAFAGLSSLPILDIYAVCMTGRSFILLIALFYLFILCMNAVPVLTGILFSRLDNPALATSFLNQYNVFCERRRNDPGHFFATGGYARFPEKVWVMEQFRRYALQFRWNEAADAVPIVPALHGSDLAIAGTPRRLILCFESHSLLFSSPFLSLLSLVSASHWSEKIAQTGFASLSTLDDGYFGKGIYFTTSLNYSLPYAYNKEQPVVILSYINMVRSRSFGFLLTRRAIRTR